VVKRQRQNAKFTLDFPHVQVSYREFEYGHMDFTFSVKEELRYYVMKCLNRSN
jgi:hypothetical protein